MSPSEISGALGLSALKNRTWAIFKTSAIKGEGLEEAMEWLVILRSDGGRGWRKQLNGWLSFVQMGGGGGGGGLEEAMEWFVILRSDGGGEGLEEAMEWLVMDGD